MITCIYNIITMIIYASTNGDTKEKRKLYNI